MRANIRRARKRRGDQRIGENSRRPERGQGAEEEPPPRATVTLAPLTISEALLPTVPVRAGTWTATLLPDGEGRFPGVHLAEDGEDVVVLAIEQDVPRGYRIVGARSEVLRAGE